jgi:GNAT superfamily N-acetyltransferase
MPDGRSLVIRPMVPGDRPAIAALFAGLSTESRAHRFHSAAVPITPATLDQVTAGHVLVAALGDHLVALGSYVAPSGAMQAELALVVADAEQGRGIGTALGARLARDAQRAGLRRFRAEIAGSNRRVLRLLRSLGCRLTSTWAFGALTVCVELGPEPAAASHCVGRLSAHQSWDERGRRGWCRPDAGTSAV